MSYRDMTFCPFYKDCSQGDTCPRALTDKVEQDAIMWWGNEHAPICVYAEAPHCFEETKAKEDIL